jgi:AraC-like DNA-binding protein
VSFEPRSVVVLQGRPIWSNSTPHATLAAHVSSYWSVRLEGRSQTVRSLPDGCSDVAFDLASPEPTAYVTGPQQHANTFEVKGRVELFGVRFLPAGAALLLGTSATNRDLWVPLSKWLGDEAHRLTQAVARAQDNAARADVLDEVLVQRLAAGSSDVRLSKAVALVFQSAGTAKIAALAKAAGASERTLNRLFEEHVGLGPKRFSRVVRFQHLLRRLDDKPNWSAFSTELGYSDQAHMIREFKQLFGCTPGDAVELGHVIRGTRACRFDRD